MEPHPLTLIAFAYALKRFGGLPTRRSRAARVDGSQSDLFPLG
jgi:hypothetical protein